MPSARRQSDVDVAARAAQLLRAHGWKLEHAEGHSQLESAWVARKGRLHYALQGLPCSESRPDRVIAQLSRGIVQAGWHARQRSMAPLAVVNLPRASEALLRKVVEFRNGFAPDVAIGVLSNDSSFRFIGPGLDAIRSESMASPEPAGRIAHAVNLFSDLNQLMLKLLLAPEIPPHLIGLPRLSYRTGAELAEVAQISVMSVSRFLRRLAEEGFVDDVSGPLRLVRRQKLFEHWRAWSITAPAPEMRMRYRVPENNPDRIQRVLSPLDACMGLFAAADALKVGHVSGVPPYVMLSRLDHLPPGWRGLDPCRAGDRVDVIVRQAKAPRSLFQAAVRVNDQVMAADVLQIWLDVAGHPSRGAEQAQFLERGVLRKVFEA
jgi:hypothetical protein